MSSWWLWCLQQVPVDGQRTPFSAAAAAAAAKRWGTACASCWHHHFCSTCAATAGGMLFGFDIALVGGVEASGAGFLCVPLLFLQLTRACPGPRSCNKTTC